MYCNTIILFVIILTEANNIESDVVLEVRAEPVIGGCGDETNRKITSFRLSVHAHGLPVR